MKKFTKYFFYGLIYLFIVFILAIIFINSSKAEIIKPNNGIEPYQVVKIQLRGLQNNDKPKKNNGIVQTWEFAHPSNKRYTGPLTKFINMIIEWQSIIIFLSIASMILGAVAAIGQNNIKRLMAYSSIGHMGYILAGLSTGTNAGVQSTIIYLVIYLLMNLAAFGCIFMMKRENLYYEDINELSGLSKNHPILALSFLIILFSLAGIPPLAGFFAKFYIFMAVIEAGMYALAIIGLLTTVISSFYYLRIIKIIYFDKAKKPFEISYDWGLKISLIFSTIVVLIYFINPSYLVDSISKITFY